VALGLCGCGGSDSARVDDVRLANRRARNNNLTDVGLQLETVDLDGNGEPDQWTYYNLVTGQPERSERDIDFDGRVDLYEYYDREGRVIEEEILLDFDDHIDVVRFYQGDGLSRRELSIGFDGSFTMIKHYDNDGNILRVEHDSSGDGQVDTWEYFENNVVVRTARDSDGDGAPDTMDGTL
jgi:hypothetical protein